MLSILGWEMKESVSPQGDSDTKYLGLINSNLYFIIFIWYNGYWIDEYFLAYLYLKATENKHKKRRGGATKYEEPQS